MQAYTNNDDVILRDSYRLFSDGLARASEQVIMDVALLVAAHTQYFNYVEDGCNDHENLWKLAEEWREENTNPNDPDPNGNGFVDILDFLYINIDVFGCP